ncbi:MAG: acyltransferase family protein [Acidocella sp.]|nr:acyltransferase family protein [Acidocella sp.]
MSACLSLNRGSEKTYFHTLSGLKGLAALMIVGYHISGVFSASIAPLAASGVDLFFLLSGVVIEKSYAQKLRAGLTPAEFIFSRAIRLYPLYAISILVMSLAITLAPGQGYFLNSSSFQVPTQNFGLLVLGSFVGVPVFNTIIMYPLNQPAWSLFLK